MAKCRSNGDEAQRARLARLLRDPTTYFDDARRQAHEQARKRLATRLDSDVTPSPGRP